MYVRKKTGITGEIAVILSDILCLNIAFIIAYYIRIGGGSPYGIMLYREVIIVICIFDMLFVRLFDLAEDFQTRGYYKEFSALVKQSIIVFALGVLYLYTVKDAHKFSRITLGIMGCVYFAFEYLARIALKKILQDAKSSERISSLLIVAGRSDAENVIKTINNGISHYSIAGIAAPDPEKTQGECCGYPVVCSVEELPGYVCHNWVDDVLIIEGDGLSVPNETLSELSETGVVIHIGMSNLHGVLGKKQFVEELDGITVLTSCVKEASALDILLKRLMDIVGGICGCIITGILFLFIAPVMAVQSPGPVFFKQKRVGRNGKIFYVYKFRSMYLDAEERKKDYMDQNRVGDGMMFKMEFDPRVIGNVVLPDGTKKTGIGNFIRTTSIDEFPQFFNVLKGEMSIVGTRPPTLDEWEKYAPHHKVRLAIKPGITGMWQTSGRSEITDFEEVVALDTKYINEWSLGLDIKLIFKTVFSMLKKDGAM